MASPYDIKLRIDNIKEQIDALNNAEAVGTNSFSVDGRTYTRQQLTSQVKELNKEVSSLEKVYAPYKAVNDDYQNAIVELNLAKEVAANPITGAPTGMSQAQADAAVAAAQAKVNEKKQKVDSSNKETVTLPKGVKVSTTTPAERQQQAGGQSAMTEAETMAAGAGFQKMGKKPKQPSVPGAPGTGGGGRIGGGPAVPPSKVSNWESKFREMFPGSSWMLDIDRTKYPDVFKIFQDAVTNRAWESEAGSMRFKAQLDNSSFMKELKSTNKVAQIKSLVGDLGFDTLPFNSFVTKAMNFGWDDVTLKQEAYKEVFRKDDAGNYANPTSVTRAKASNDYLRIANIGKAYFNNLSDDTIEKALVGGLTTEDVERQQREVAKTKYSHLGNLIDQGVTLKELSSSFQSQAAQLLERDPNSIDMSTADFEQAFNFGEEGKKRMMTSGEWEIKLRSDPRFNWDKTQNAKQEAMSLATTIAQAFGKVI